MVLITEIAIRSFGVLRDTALAPGAGLTVVEGPNESGKTALAMFLKFVFYGLPANRGADKSLSDRARFVNWETGEAAGSVTLCDVATGRSFRIERQLVQSRRIDTDGGDRETYRESLKVVDLATGEAVPTKTPGEYFYGMTEDVYESTVFLRQMAETALTPKEAADTVENLLLTGDETADTAKALARLDEARVQLLYKNKNGGKLYQLETAAAAARARRDEAVSAAAARLEDERALAEIRVQREECRREAQRIRTMLDGCRLLRQVRQIGNAAAAAAAVKEAEEALAPLEADPADQAYLAAVKSAAAQLAQAEARVEEAEAALVSMKKELPRETGLCGEALSVAADGYRRAKRRQSAGLACTLVGVLAALAGAARWIDALAVLRVMPLPVGMALSALGILLTVVGSALLVRAGGRLKAAHAVFCEYGVEAADAASAGARLTAEENDRITAADEKRQTLSDSLRLAETVRDDCRCRCEALCDQVGAAGETTDDRLADARAKAEVSTARRAAAQQVLTDARADLRLADSLLAGVDREAARREAAALLETETGKAAAALSDADEKKQAQNEGFYREKDRALEEREKTLALALERARAVTAAPDVAESALRAIEEEYERLRLRYDALVLAEETLREASENIRRNVVPRVAAETGRLIDRLTAGRYRAILADGSLRLTYRSENDLTRSEEVLSAGTRDLFWIAARLALIRVMTGGRAAPAVLDESFCRMDEARLGRMVEILASGEGGQCILLTCRHAEAAAAEGLPVTVVRLGS